MVCWFSDQPQDSTFGLHIPSTLLDRADAVMISPFLLRCMSPVAAAHRGPSRMSALPPLPGYSGHSSAPGLVLRFYECTA